MCRLVRLADNNMTRQSSACLLSIRCMDLAVCVSAAHEPSLSHDELALFWTLALYKKAKHGYAHRHTTGSLASVCPLICRKAKLVLAVQQWHNNSLAAAFNNWSDQVLLKVSHRNKVNTTGHAIIWKES